MKYIFSLVVLMFMSGCVSYQPVPEGYDGGLASVQDTSNQISSTKVQFFQLAKVDGRSVETSSVITYSNNYGRGFAMDVVTTRREVPAGKVKLYLQGVTHVAAPILALGGGMYGVEGSVEVTLLEDEYYSVAGTLSKEYSAVWLEDSAGNVVSQKIENIED